MSLGRELHGEGFITTVRRRSASLADNVKKELSTLKRRVTISASAEGAPEEHTAAQFDDASKALKLSADEDVGESMQLHLGRPSGAEIASAVEFKRELHSSSDDSAR